MLHGGSGVAHDFLHFRTFSKVATLLAVKQLFKLHTVSR